MSLSALRVLGIVPPGRPSPPPPPGHTTSSRTTDARFAGSNCHQVDLVPQPDFEGHDNPQYPTWGGRSLFADGKWHFVASYMENQCDIWDYGTNSAYLRATADRPWGPFVFQETVLPPFHHGAHVDRSPEGKFLIFGDGKDMPDSTVKKNCNVFGPPGRGLRTDDGEAKKKNGDSTLYPRGDSPNDVHMVAVADKITGPWQQHIILKTDFSRGENAWDCNVTNLAPWINEDGSIIMAFRSKPCVPMSSIIDKCGRLCQSIGIAESANGWRGPFIKRPDEIANLAGNEDPFLWKSKRGWHMLLHGKFICGTDQESVDTCGAMAYSLDSYTWFYSPFPAYEGTVEFEGRRSETLEYRHRPKITFDNYGVPMVLYNGAKRFNRPYIQNMAFRFNTVATHEFRQPASCPKSGWTYDSCGYNTYKGQKRKRDATGCASIGPNKCLWCPKAKLCVPAGSRDICDAPDPTLFYAHCPQI